MKEPLLETLFEEIKVPHIVKRASFPWDGLDRNVFSNSESIFHENPELAPNYNDILNDLSSPEAVTFKSSAGLTVELALFFDEAAYKIFAPHLNYDDNRIQDMLLAYMNGVSGHIYISNIENS